MKMKRIGFACGILAALLCSGCSKEETPVTDTPSQTVLLYISGDNSLSSFGEKNIQQAAQGARDAGLDGGNLIAYYDARSAAPLLLQIKETGIDTLQVYPERNSADPAVMRSVIDEVLAGFPAERYGLVLWSHGSAWLPASYTTLLRAFGQDDNAWLELEDLAAALPDHRFDYILFDACYMASIEVLYELRDKADYLIGSPTEILGSGFPYAEIVRYLFAGTAGLEPLCAAFHAYYDRQSGLSRSASVSLSATAQVEALAELVAEIQADIPTDTLYALPAAEMQPFDYLLGNIHLLYDFDDYISRLATPEQYARFRQLLAQVVRYKQSTPQATYGITGNPRLDITRFSGLSVYLPQPCSEPLTAWYTAHTAWGKKTRQP